MAESSLEQERKTERRIWVGIVLLPFLCLLVDFFSGTSGNFFASATTADTLWLKIFYPPMLCLPSFVLACFLEMDEFAKIMLGFCLVVLSYLPIHFFMQFLMCLRAGTCF